MPPIVGRLLFPSERLLERGREGMISDTRKGLDAIAGRVGWEAGEIRTKIFRHSWCAARLQTLVNGYPIQPWQVAREMGHRSLEMVLATYSHLGSVVHRAEHVEFRLEHCETMPEVRQRLRHLRAA